MTDFDASTYQLGGPGRVVTQGPTTNLVHLYGEYTTPQNATDLALFNTIAASDRIPLLRIPANFLLLGYSLAYTAFGVGTLTADLGTPADADLFDADINLNAATGVMTGTLTVSTSVYNTTETDVALTIVSASGFSAIGGRVLRLGMFGIVSSSGA